MMVKKIRSILFGLMFSLLIRNAKKGYSTHAFFERAAGRSAFSVPGLQQQEFNRCKTDSKLIICSEITFVAYADAVNEQQRHPAKDREKERMLMPIRTE